MLFCGVPIFLQEVAIGQYLGAGGMTMIAKICPILKGKKSLIMIIFERKYIAYIILPKIMIIFDLIYRCRNSDDGDGIVL